ncbi:F-box protein CPR1-like [Lycium barbarum]|uniref:F-box protein CPR1-like n=1 Tax=Lycium barbarum TaxID=112863 RepID=UPI00293F1E61|nr:F-box protein CPR1-like [Lycium barbarum]
MYSICKNAKYDKLLIEQSSKDGKCTYYFSSLLTTKTTSNQIVEDVQKSLFVPGYYKIYCGCDGLFIIGIGQGEDSICWLWNPSTRESIPLPPHQKKFFDISYSEYSVYGLGYDPTSDDYKVFKVPEEDEDAPNEILSLKTGSWRKIFVGRCCIESFGMDYLAFLQGTFHWLSYLGCGMSMITFNISNEVFGELPLPGEMRFNGHIDQGVAVLGGMLSVNYFGEKESNTIFDLWVMKDYGVKESWTKLFSMVDTRALHEIMQIVPKYIFEDGEVLLGSDRRTAFRTFKESHGTSSLIGPLVGDEDIFEWDGFAYTESLISPKDCVLA